MSKTTKDPLAGKSQALKAALAAVERRGGTDARRAAKAEDLAAQRRRARPQVPDAEHRDL